jgi:hypothetical protein
MTKLATRSNKLSGVLAHEYAPEFGFCRKDATVTIEDGMDVGAVVVRSLTSATGTVTAGTNTGNGAFGTVTVADTAAEGNFTVKIISAATNAGDFIVKNPDGVVVGHGTVAVAFSGGGLSFTIADGGTDFAVGDSWTIAVAGTVKYKWVESADVATLNSDVAVLIGGKDGLKDIPNLDAGDHTLTILYRGPAAVVDAGMTYKDELDDDEIAIVEADLEAKGITVRTGV